MYNIPKTETNYSGNPASFTVQSGESIGSLTASIAPVQNLNGYSSPWPAGGGKNKFDEQLTLGLLNSDGSVSETSSRLVSDFIPVEAGEEYAFVWPTQFGRGRGAFYDSSKNLVQYLSDFPTDTTHAGEGYGLVNVPSGASYLRFNLTQSYGTTYENDIALNYPSSVTTYSPYSNICPITGRTGLSVYVSPTEDVADATTYAVDWTSEAGTVYGGTVDVVTGVLNVTHQFATYNGSESWSASNSENPVYYMLWNQPNSVSNTDMTQIANWLVAGGNSYQRFGTYRTQTNGAVVVGNLDGNVQGAYHFPTVADFKSYLASNPLQVCYELATPLTYQLTPQQVTALVGQNYVWSDLNSTVSVTVLSESPFHELAISGSAQTRCRIYFIGDNVDCTDDNDVQTNGTLLRSDPSENDSNSMIDSSSGLSITEAFNKDTEYGVGSAASYTISCSFLNLNDALSGFDFGKCKIYIDVYDSDNSTWIPCPLGVFYFDVPVKRRVRIISATGYDQMSLLDTIADTWWNGLDWPGGLTIENIIQLLVGTLNIHLNANSLTNIVNGSLSFTEAPFKSVERTYRDILQFIAEATGTIAVFDRDGALNFRWFSEAQIGGNTVEINVDSPNTTCLSIDAAEYTVPAIDQLVVKASDLDVGAAVGSGDNQYAITNNPFMGGPDEATITAKATPIYNRISALGAYSPVSLKLVADYSIEAGDIISVVYQGITYTLPIFQQTLTWRGGYVSATPQSSGDQNRQPQTASKREEFRSKTQMHEFEVNLERLLSRIESISGDYTQIEQDVHQISQTVYAQGITISDILDPTGEIWSAITSNSTHISNVESSLNGEINTRKSYIRFIPAEPAIVLGVDTGHEIKLKLVNNVIYFFNGADDSTDLSLAYAYFNSEEAGADRFVASESVQTGDWKWHQLTNGHFVLDYMG